MFAYEYDRFDQTLGEEQAEREGQLGKPEGITLGGQPYPEHIDDYDQTPPNESDGQPSEHLNSTILSHAYWHFVQSVGHHKAGRVLHNVPSMLPPRPVFNSVVNALIFRSGEIYPQDGPDAGSTSDVKEAAQRAISHVGIVPQSHD